MNFLTVIVLGLVQGFSEFLPISSSGHLVIFQKLLGLSEPGILLEIVLHLASTMAVIYYFREDLRNIKFRFLVLLIVATVPAGIVGILFKHQITALFSSTKIVGLALLITAAMNYSTDRQSGRRERVDMVDAVLVGIAQAFAIIPGISRSGATIFAATQMNVDRKTAARFSFLLSIPAILGANVLEFFSTQSFDDFSPGLYVVGFIAAFIASLVAIQMVLQLLVDKRFKYFAYYALAIGILTLIFI